jgi:hypothetical protein
VLAVEERAHTAGSACWLDIVEEGTDNFHPILPLFFYASGEPVYIPNTGALFHRNSSCEPAARTLQVHHQYEQWSAMGITTYNFSLSHGPAPGERAAASNVRKTIVSTTETYHGTGKSARSHKNRWKMIGRLRYPGGS